MQPSFLFIGPDKCGSTWLYEILLEHPCCYVPECKDIYFFDRYYHRGTAWYLSFFGEAPAGSVAVGELSHDYIFSVSAAERISRDLPGVKLLSSLRNPVDRTFSQYLFMIRGGRTREPFETALQKFPWLIDGSMYHKHLSEYFRRFDRRDIKVVLFDRLVADPRDFAREIFEFLGLPFLDSIRYERQVLPASRPRSAVIARLAKLGANACRNMRLTNLVGTVKYSPLAGLLYRKYRKGEKPAMDPETRRRLVEIFRPDVHKLEDLLGKDLSQWLEPGN